MGLTWDINHDMCCHDARGILLLLTLQLYELSLAQNHGYAKVCCKIMLSSFLFIYLMPWRIDVVLYERCKTLQCYLCCYCWYKVYMVVEWVQQQGCCGNWWWWRAEQVEFMMVRSNRLDIQHLAPSIIITQPWLSLNYSWNATRSKLPWLFPISATIQIMVTSVKSVQIYCLSISHKNMY